MVSRVFAVLALAVTLAAPASAQALLKRSEEFLGACVLSVTNLAKPVVLSTAGAMSCSWSNSEIAQRNEVCFVNENVYSTNTVRVSSFSTVDSTRYGWPIRGTEKECHAWGANMPVWIWRDTSNPNQTVTILLTK